MEDDGYAVGRRFIDYLEPYDADLDLWDDMRSLGHWEEDTVPVNAPCPECGSAEDELRGLHAHATIMEDEELAGGRAFTALVAVSCATCGWSVNLYGWVNNSSWPMEFGLNASPVLLSYSKARRLAGELTGAVSAPLSTATVLARVVFRGRGDLARYAEQQTPVPRPEPKNLPEYLARRVVL